MRASKPSDPLDVDPTVNEILTLKPCFAQKPLPPLQGLSAKFLSTVGSPSKGTGDMLARLYLSLACILVVVVLNSGKNNYLSAIQHDFSMQKCTYISIGVLYPGYRGSLITTHKFGYDRFPP
jgi:hypothetical protein